MLAAASSPAVTACVVGADAVLADSSIVNKTGTSLLTASATAKDIPCYILCDTLKVSKSVFTIYHMLLSESLLLVWVTNILAYM